MTAPDFPTLYAFEENLEGVPSGEGTPSGFAKILDGLGGATVYTQRSGQLVKTPLFDLQVVVGESSEHRNSDNGNSDNEKYFRYDVFDFTLNMTFVTDRTENFAAHTKMMGQVRALLENPVLNVNVNQNFPFYWIMKLKHRGTVPAFHSDDNTDTSRISYAGKFNILPAAWPAS